MLDSPSMTGEVGGVGAHRRVTRPQVLAQEPASFGVSQASQRVGQITAGERLVFRTGSSSAHRAVDAAFLRAGLSPSPVLVLDGQDGVLEAVANGLGIGFAWRNASARQDPLVRIPVAELGQHVEEHVFHLSHPVSAIAPHFMRVAAEAVATEVVAA